MEEPKSTTPLTDQYGRQAGEWTVDEPRAQFGELEFFTPDDLGEFDERSVKQMINAAKRNLGPWAAVPEGQRIDMIKRMESELLSRQTLLADLSGVEKRIKGDR